MAIDEFLNETELNAQKLQTDIQRFKKLAIAMGVLCVVLAFIFVYFNGSLQSDYKWTLPIGLTTLVLVGGLVITLLVALIPYQTFNYQKRFLRYYLMVILFLYAMLNCIWTVAIVAVLFKN